MKLSKLLVYIVCMSSALSNYMTQTGEAPNIPEQTIMKLSISHVFISLYYLLYPVLIVIDNDILSCRRLTLFGQLLQSVRRVGQRHLIIGIKYAVKHSKPTLLRININLLLWLSCSKGDSAPPWRILLDDLNLSKRFTLSHIETSVDWGAPLIMMVSYFFHDWNAQLKSLGPVLNTNCWSLEEKYCSYVICPL